VYHPAKVDPMRNIVRAASYECDGCRYELYPEQTAVVSMMVDGASVQFHFHSPASGGSHDCLRYWITGPRVMERSLVARGIDEETRDVLLSRTSWRQPTRGARR